MKTSVNLPKDLMRRVKRQADHTGCTMDQAMAALLIAGLDLGLTDVSASSAPVSKRLPLIKTRALHLTEAKALTSQEFCELIKDVEQQDEVERQERATGHKHMDRVKR